jgi:cyclopropane-fatty-acyl-phospholipid synthase
VTNGFPDSEKRLPTGWEAIAYAVLRRLRYGTLTVVMPWGEEHVFAGKEPGPEARVVIHDRAFVRRVVTGSNIGLAEGYMDGQWDTPDLDALLDLGVVNSRAGMAARLPVLSRPAQRAWHALRDNTRAGSRQNVEYHYDLGNDFYELWLDDTMTYSCANFETGTDDLRGAQVRKWDRVLELVQPGPRDRLLEIGCGWGGFAIHAAKAAGCRVTGITLSQEQAALARERVEREGLEGQVDIRIEDYRDVRERFTAIASIEMFEAVGQRWWPTFFERIRALLEPGRAAALQVITIDDDQFDSYARNPDFTQRYIFPGGMLPSPSRFRAVAEAAGLDIASLRFFGHDYARTLEQWAKRFECVVPQVKSLGFDDRFVRMWRYYLSYCRAGFDSGNIDVMQVRLVSSAE